jgi:hypothetical protein
MKGIGAFQYIGFELISFAAGQDAGGRASLKVSVVGVRVSAIPSGFWL